MGGGGLLVCFFFFFSCCCFSCAPASFNSHPSSHRVFFSPCAQADRLTGGVKSAGGSVLQPRVRANLKASGANLDGDTQKMLELAQMLGISDPDMDRLREVCWCWGRRSCACVCVRACAYMYA